MNAREAAKEATRYWPRCPGNNLIPGGHISARAVYVARSPVVFLSVRNMQGGGNPCKPPRSFSSPSHQ